MSSDRTIDDVGVVIIGRNEGERLVRCLRSLKSQSAFLVYVDSGSSDGSVEVADAHGASIVHLTEDRNFTAARARNAGFEKLQEIFKDIRFVQFIDGDCELDPAWIRKGRCFLKKEPDVAVVCGRRREKFPHASVFNQLCDYEWNTPVGDAKSSGGDMLIRADVFKEAGGFRNELMAGEEPELCHRIRALGLKVWRLDAAMTAHDANIISFAQWWRRTKRTGYGYAQVFDCSRGTTPRLYSREVMRAVVWGGAMPLIILASTFFAPPLMFIALTYMVPLLRAVGRHRMHRYEAWLYSVFLLLGKFAEFHGVLRYAVVRLTGQFQKSIEYKAAL